MARRILMATGYTTDPCAPDFAGVVGGLLAGMRHISDGGSEVAPSVPRAPLNVTSEETFEGWIRCADGRTLWEYATHQRG